MSLVNPLNNLRLLHEVERTPPGETTNTRQSVYILSTYFTEPRDLPFDPR